MSSAALPVFWISTDSSSETGGLPSMAIIAACPTLGGVPAVATGMKISALQLNWLGCVIVWRLRRAKSSA